ncbi:mannitol dehydrogenase family protein [Croceicoccus sediminis]|uniref:mannitol dehydrogenase family protein n=1 Tax=Croceicoccus sediminis TaxID=2571150 RepID=UPI001182658C|nr:mannitol dehydrogenase family protein [Croceicoccus sediminis]
MRLSQDTIGQLPDDVAVPAYDRAAAPSIVHFGIGAFHRAHQAAFTDACNREYGAPWMITGVSMRSATVADQLNPQDSLYTLTERTGEGSDTRVIGAIANVLVAGEDRDAIVAQIASATCHIVTFTVTEKGYCRALDGSLDLGMAEAGFYPMLCDALEQRRAAGLPGLSLLSCDNLSGNGKQLGRLMRDWIDARVPDLREWFDGHCTTPDSMVDRIVPAPSADDLDALERRIGLRDEGAIFTEGFSQWVIEDDFAGPRPAWETQGVQIVDDVAPYETAKLRMLNGAHSLLAYAGLDGGHTYVHEAVADPQLRTLVTRLMLKEAAPTIEAGEGQDLASYAAQLVQRFENPALNHRLEQIAMDGSQKIGQRWLEVLAEHPGDGLCEAILTGIAHWLHHASGKVRTVDDPRVDELQAACADGPGTEAVRAVFGATGLIRSAWTPSDAETDFIVGKWRDLV